MVLTADRWDFNRSIKLSAAALCSLIIQIHPLCPSVSTATYEAAVTAETGEQTHTHTHTSVETSVMPKCPRWRWSTRTFSDWMTSSAERGSETPSLSEDTKSSMPFFFSCKTRPVSQSANQPIRWSGLRTSLTFSWLM